ncbi:MAG: hypothetical protein H0U23_00130 [Blastocatellia bacterium]|nr:hypothetical protein [Blastocatellia bacterium]
MKTMLEIREILCDQMDAIKDDKITPNKANSIINAVGKLLHSIRIELEYAKLTGRTPSTKMLG